MYGVGEWRRIRSDPNIAIHVERTHVDLKDKWRNLVAYRQYSEQSTFPISLSSTNCVVW